jgi:hypothetical protein
MITLSNFERLITPTTTNLGASLRMFALSISEATCQRADSGPLSYPAIAPPPSNYRFPRSNRQSRPNSRLPAAREMRHQSKPAHLFNLFSDSLQKYEKQTGIALSKHSLAEQLRDSDSAESVTAILLEQVPAYTGFGGTDRITKSLCNVVSVLFTLSISVEVYSVRSKMLIGLFHF